MAGRAGMPVKAYHNTLYRKLGVGGRQDAVRAAIDKQQATVNAESTRI